MPSNLVTLETSDTRSMNRQDCGLQGLTIDGFLSSAFLAEETAKSHAAYFAPNVDGLVQRILRLYQGTSMPMSDAKGLGH